MEKNWERRLLVACQVKNHVDIFLAIIHFQIDKPGDMDFNFRRASSVVSDMVRFFLVNGPSKDFATLLPGSLCLTRRGD